MFFQMGRKKMQRAIRRAVAPVFETLEARKMLAVDTSKVWPLPYVLEFNSASATETFADKDGQFTGFNKVQPNKLGTQYQPQRVDLDVAAGVLRMTSAGTSTAGTNWELDNTQTNAYGVQFNGSLGQFTITTRLIGPLSNIDTPYEQAGLMFGVDQDNYVKLVAGAQPNGQFLQFVDEQKTSTGFFHGISSNSNYNIGPFNAINTLDLQLFCNPSSGTVVAQYRINDGKYVMLNRTLTLGGAMKSAFFGPATKAWIFVANKNDAGPLTATFDRFAIEAGQSASSLRPSITATRPGDTMTDVSRDAFIAADLNLPNAGHGIDAGSMNGSTVKLTRTSDGATIKANINTDGGGGAIVLQPQELLDANTNYTFTVTAGLKDTLGAAFVPYQISFTTGTKGANSDPSIAFEKIGQPNATGQMYTGLTIGPDKKLYASTFDGKIFRWTIDGQGNLVSPEQFNTVIAHEGTQRIITGLTFDPASTADNLILWISHGQYAFENATDFTGKISRLTGPNLGVITDMVSNLPRSMKDHLTNQLVFGPDGALYFSQGSNTAMGGYDPVWGNRPEHLLNAAILRLDTKKVVPALDSRTKDAGGSYDPFAPGVPLTIYATGIRNAYDLIWHSNGHLYAPTNGSAAGGNTPAYPNPLFTQPRIDQATRGPFSSAPIASLQNVRQTQNDYLFDVVNGGYYGHPNPVRGEFILNGGNPNPGVDPNEVSLYPVGTQPDRNYRGAVYSFGQNYSPNGVIEYKGNAFDGKLNGKLLVARYSGGDDIIALELDGAGKVVKEQTGIAGFKGLVDPLDLTQDSTGQFLYVIEFGASKITLLRPVTPGAHAAVDKSKLYFNDPRGGSVSQPVNVTITNTGSSGLALPADAFTIVGGDASLFLINKPTLPATIAPGQSVTFSLTFAPTDGTSISIKTATLQIKTNDVDRPIINVSLRGLPTTGTGGNNEPSLQRLLELFEIPVNVGDTNPNDTALDTPPRVPNDEMPAQQLKKANPNLPVTFKPLAMMGVNTTPAVRFGYYEPGSPGGTQKQLFTIAAKDAQWVDPTVLGSTIFDPGTAAFGLYTVWPNFKNADGSIRNVFSEDALNTWDPVNPRKVRFYPMKNPDGSAVPNTYVVAFEEFDKAFDSNDLVGIITNVTPVAAAPELGIENIDGQPYVDRLVFNKIQNKNPNFPDFVHDVAQLRIRNTGNSPLVIFSNSVTGAWQIDGGLAPNTVIAPGGSIVLNVRFTATRGGLQFGKLNLVTNDPDEPNRGIDLAGFWQNRSEHGEEPVLQQIAQLFGFTTNFLNPGQDLDQNGQVQTVGEEVLSPYWQAADSSLPVNVRQLAAFHNQGQRVTLFWHQRGSSSTTAVLAHYALDGQAILPRKDVNGQPGGPAFGSFSPTTAFGFRISSNPGEWSDDTLNDHSADIANGGVGPVGHHVRFFPVRDRDGSYRSNTYLMVNDFAGINYDYQDNVYLVTNIKPFNVPAAPQSLSAGSKGGILVQWAPNAEGNIAGYNIYRSNTPTGSFTQMNASLLTSPEYEDTAAAAGSTYYYQVTAVNTSGVESSRSSTKATRYS